MEQRSDRNTDERLTFLDAAERVLGENGVPTHYRDITEQAISQGLLVSSGNTPEATLSAQISIHRKNAREKGDIPRFSSHGRGVYGLSAWEPRGVWHEVYNHNRKVKDALLTRVMSLSPQEFEHLVSDLITVLGFETVEVTKYTGDGGVDVTGTVSVTGGFRFNMAVQVKRWTANVGSREVRDLRGSLGPHQRGLIVSTSGFAEGARTEAERSDAVPIGLMDGQSLVDLLAANEVGVTRTTVDIFEPSDAELTVT